MIPVTEGKQVARIVCFGEILIRLSAPGRELMLQTPRLESHVGGAEANVAVSLARLGHEARAVIFNINKIDDKIISIEMGFNPFGIMDKNNDSNNGF